jgi:hypothetical protein
MYEVPTTIRYKVLPLPPFVFDGGRLAGSKPHDAPAQTAKSSFEQGNTTFPKKFKKNLRVG